MRKANKIIIVICSLISIFLLLSLWCYFGFEIVHFNFHLNLLILWWFVIIFGGLIVYKLEQKRRAEIRTIYILSDNSIFNFETGVIPIPIGDNLFNTVRKVIANLRYDFNRQTLPADSKVKMIIFSNDFEYDKKKDEIKEWKGWLFSDGKRMQVNDFNTLLSLTL